MKSAHVAVAAAPSLGQASGAGRTSFIQRKCACGSPTSSLAGECTECKSKKRLQTKLTIGASNDPLEQEADRIADQVLASSINPTVSGALPHIQRVTGQPSAPAGIAPASVDRVLASAGRPLEPALRKDMEQRFGHDFSRVRVHSDGAAEQSARDMGARAYTVGQDIVFGADQYQPGSDAGRHLLSHELTHTIQQRVDAVRVQRQCVASLCPPALVPIDALYPRYDAAEKCIQTMYASSHPAKPGISLSYNAEWLHLTGGSPNEKKALSCLRGEETPGAGPNFTAKGMMYAAAPDIWDFLNTTMYEITTLSGATFRIGKIGAQIALANQICGRADCGGLQFDRGTWAPSVGCYALGGDLYFKAYNDRGVIIYSMYKDATKELALAAVLAAMAVALKSMGPKAGAAAAGKAIGGKLVPGYVIASLAACAVLLASGRAEAKLGPGDEEPLVSLFKELDKKGTKVPPEIQKMLDANPELKEKMNKALGKGGDPSKLQDEINKQILDTIAANKDKFTPEELELLLATTQVAGKALPKADMTADELKKLAAAVKAGKTGGGGPGGGDAPAIPGVTPPAKKEDPKTKDAPPGKEATDQITQPTRDKLAKAPAPVRDLFSGLLGKGPHANKLTDAQVQRFLTMMPSGLTADQVTKLLEKRKPVEGETADQVLDTLQTILADLNKPAAPKPGAGVPATPVPAPGAPSAPAPAPNVTITTGPTVSSSNKKTPEEVIKELAATAKKSSFTDVAPATFRVTWKPEEKGPPTKGSVISGLLRGKLQDGTTFVGRIDADVTAADGRNLKVVFSTATPMVSAAGKVVFQPDRFVGHESTVVLDWPKKSISK